MYVLIEEMLLMHVEDGYTRLSRVPIPLINQSSRDMARHAALDEFPSEAVFRTRQLQL